MTTEVSLCCVGTQFKSHKAVQLAVKARSSIDKALEDAIDEGFRRRSENAARAVASAFSGAKGAVMVGFRNPCGTKELELEYLTVIRSQMRAVGPCLCQRQGRRHGAQAGNLVEVLKVDSQSGWCLFRSNARCGLRLRRRHGT